MARNATAIVPNPGETQNRANFRHAAETRASKVILAMRALRSLNRRNESWEVRPQEDFTKMLNAIEYEKQELAKFWAAPLGSKKEVRFSL